MNHYRVLRALDDESRVQHLIGYIVERRGSIEQAQLLERPSRGQDRSDQEYNLPEAEKISESRVASVGKTTIPIPVGALKRGRNSIIFEAYFFGPGDNEYDDFAFGEVYLILNQ